MEIQSQPESIKKPYIFFHHRDPHCAGAHALALAATEACRLALPPTSSIELDRQAHTELGIVAYVPGPMWRSAIVFHPAFTVVLLELRLTRFFKG